MRRLGRYLLAGALLLLVAQGVAPTVADAAAPAAVRVRKNVKALTPQERHDFVNAVLALKTTRSPFDPRLNYYDQFVAWHLALYPCGMDHAMTRAHGGPLFLPWHRRFLQLFENALRDVSGKPIAVPYWDWTDPESTKAVFAADFMGGDGDRSAGYAVTTGPFRKGRWLLKVHPAGMQWGPSKTTYLTRHFGSFPIQATLPARADVTFLMGRPTYDVKPFDPGSDPNQSFRNTLEGFWRGAGPVHVTTGSASMVCTPDGFMSTVSGEGIHNRVHGYVGGVIGAGPSGPRFGTMLLPTSPNDPVFFLHHANIDRLWTEWQQTHGIDSYRPRTTAHQPMHPFGVSPADVADVTALGYRYDTARATRVPFWCDLVGARR